MQVSDLNDVETFEVDERTRVAFPVSSATGTAATAGVWIEPAPGGEVAEDTDTAEELLYVARGEVEATVGDETGTLRAGNTGARVFVVGGPVPIMLPLDEPVEV